MEELVDRWILGLRGSQVVSVSVSEGVGHQGLVLMLDCEAKLAVQGPAFLTYGAASAPGADLLSGEEWQALVGATVVSAIAFKSGALRAVFSTGHHLNIKGGGPESAVRVQKTDEFEWSYRGGTGVMKVFGATTS
ncbi:DUF6188 family protein [Streptomyces sp. NBC_00439]|uniref:DUF6188 family protein n=1 Tax=Streptomyces sp. NBC_00439 TaxID=2903650 RepID=UPI00225B49FD|nr:DUF6188 family protein [Streptomyces sp. NBC_00439]MCX5102904.1 DUF6188 family protein [Streptomyces sp. NBC_00439]